MSSTSEAAARVAEYVRQRDLAMSGGNVGDVITTVYADSASEPADLNVEDLRLLLAAPLFLPESERRDRIAQAVYDPGSVVGPRRGPSWLKGHPGYAEDQENLWDWVVRAVLRVV